MEAQRESKIKEALLEHIIHLINESGGVKVSELDHQVWHSLLRKDHEINQAMEKLGLNDLVEELVQQKKIVEIEYILPDGSLKTFYLPGRTQVNIRGQEAKPHRI